MFFCQIEESRNNIGRSHTKKSTPLQVSGYFARVQLNSHPILPIAGRIILQYFISSQHTARQGSRPGKHAPDQHFSIFGLACAGEVCDAPCLLYPVVTVPVSCACALPGCWPGCLLTVLLSCCCCSQNSQSVSQHGPPRVQGASEPDQQQASGSAALPAPAAAAPARQPASAQQTQHLPGSSQ